MKKCKKMNQKYTSTNFKITTENAELITRIDIIHPCVILDNYSYRIFMNSLCPLWYTFFS